MYERTLALIGEDNLNKIKRKKVHQRKNNYNPTFLLKKKQ